MRKSGRLWIALGIIVPSALVIQFFVRVPGWVWIVWEVAGAALVVYGCAGEWRVEEGEADRIREGDGRHRLALRYVVAVTFGVTMELAGLVHSIPEAVKQDREIAFLQTSNAWIWKTNLKLEVRVEGLRRANSEFEKEVADAKRRAAELELAASEINRQATPRGLTAEQDRTLVRELVRTPSNSVTIVTTVGDAESSDFADEFEAALVRARWSISRKEWSSMKLEASPFMDGPAPRGWPTNVLGDWLTYSALREPRLALLPRRLSGILVGHNFGTPSPSASALLEALKKVDGLDPRDFASTYIAAGSTLLMVAPKPAIGLRSIIPREFHPGAGASNSLSKFGWTNTIVVYDPEDSFDVVPLSAQIASVLGGSHLNTNLPAWMSEDRYDRLFGEGVTVAAVTSFGAAVRAGAVGSRGERWSELNRQRGALVEELNKAGIAAERGWLGSTSGPYGWIVIKVGTSPGREARRMLQDMRFEETNWFSWPRR